MHYGATYYNIPWMLLYFCSAKPVYGKLVHDGSPLYDMLKDRKDVLLTKYNELYYKVDKTGELLDLQYSVILHERRIVDDEVREEIHFCLYSLDENDLPIQETEVVLDINVYRFPCLIHSEKAMNYRKDELLQIAKQLMPDLQ